MDRAALQRRTLRVLVGAQVLGGAGIGVGAAVSPLLAKDILDGDGTFAGLAFSSLTVGAALAAVPLSRLMARRGRRPGLVRGYATAAVGAALAVTAAEVESFPLLLVGMLLLGSGTSANLLARYAGADLAEPDRRGRSIATVVWATTVGAVAGPNALGPAGRVADALALPPMAGPYVVGLACFGGAAALVATSLRPDPLVVAGGLEAAAPAAAGQAVPAPAPGTADHVLGAAPALSSSPSPSSSSVRSRLAAIFADRRASTGLATMVAAHAVMVSVMTMTPLHLRDHGDSLEVVGLVISLHIAGMYALAPVVGAVADRVGHLQVARASAFTLATAAGLAALAGHRHVAIALALTLLGLGWSMATISGATLLTAAVPASDRAQTQGVADLTMGLAGGLGGTVSGIVVGTVGYASLSAAAAALAVLVLLRPDEVLRHRRDRQAVHVEAGR